MEFQGLFKKVKEVAGVFQGCFDSVLRNFKGSLKCVKSFSNKASFVVVLWQSSQLPEQKEGGLVLFFL